MHSYLVIGITEMSVEIQFDGTAASTPSAVIIEAVASVANRPPEDLPALYDAIDPEAIDRLFTHGSADGVELSFHYYGYDITVEPDKIVIFEHA